MFHDQLSPPYRKWIHIDLGGKTGESVLKESDQERGWPARSFLTFIPGPLEWRHNGHDSVSNHQPHDCLLNRLFRRRSKKTSNLRVTGLCVGNSPGTGEFPAQMASNAENVSIWWRHHAAARREGDINNTQEQKWPSVICEINNITRLLHWYCVEHDWCGTYV